MISVILPLFRTRSYLAELHRRLTAVLSAREEDYELLMVDDGSPDGIWQAVKELASRDPHVRGICLSRNFGQHPAIAAALDHAVGDRLILMDADLQDTPEDIPSLLDQLRDDVHVVYTTKQGPTESLSVRVTSRVYHAVISRVLRTNVPKNVGTFRAFTRTFADALRGYPEHNVLFGPLMFHVGFRHAVVPVRREQRVGQSSYTFRKRLQLAVNSLISYTDLPHRIFINAGLIVLFGSLFYGLALVGCYLFMRQEIPPGLNLIVLLLTLLLGATMLSLGIIGTYVFRIFQEVLRRPRYVVAARLNFTREDDALDRYPGQYRGPHAHGGKLRSA